MRPVLFAIPLLAVFLQNSSPTFTFPGGKVEARGVCNIEPERVTCWDMAGVTSSTLEDSVRKALANGADASFRLGMKNRYLVVRRPQNLYLNYRGSGNTYLYSNLANEGEPRTEYVHLAAENSDASGMIGAQITVQAPTDIEFSLREGTKVAIEGWNLEVGAAQKMVVPKGPPSAEESRTYGSNNIPPSFDRWTVIMGLTGPSGEYANWAYTPLDSSGAPIRYVDPRGRPVTAIRALELEPTLQPSNGYRGFTGQSGSGGKPKAMVAIFQGTGLAPVFRATTNVDPRWISRLRVRPSHQETITLGPFPLDPR